MLGTPICRSRRAGDSFRHESKPQVPCANNKHVLTLLYRQRWKVPVLPFLCLSTCYLNMTKEQPVVDAHQGKQLSSCLVHPQLTGENNFRLLRVMPAQENGSSIHCKLFPASFTAQAQKYIAGSYVWGPPQPTLPIFVNGCIVHVRENLAHFLRACRTRFSYRTLWIDALCISK
jgi:hypothetical protein